MIIHILVLNMDISLKNTKFIKWKIGNTFQQKKRKYYTKLNLGNLKAFNKMNFMRVNMIS